jgi:hypothetical protein
LHKILGWVFHTERAFHPGSGFSAERIFQQKGLIHVERAAILANSKSLQEWQNPRSVYSN